MNRTKGILTEIIENLSERRLHKGGIAAALTEGTYFSAADIALPTGKTPELYRIVVIRRNPDEQTDGARSVAGLTADSQ